MKYNMIMTALVLIAAFVFSTAAAFAGEDTMYDGISRIQKNVSATVSAAASKAAVNAAAAAAEASAAAVQTQAKSERPDYNILLDVPKLSTQDKRWENYYYDEGAKIGKYGCLLVSCTAVLSQQDGENYRPDKLSAKFRFNDGYMQWGKGWGKRFEPNVKYSLKTIRTQLKEGRPVIVHGYSKEYGHHYAVITGVQDSGTKTSQFTVMDPSYSKTKTLAQFFKMFPNKKKLVLIEK